MPATVLFGEEQVCGGKCPFTGIDYKSQETVNETVMQLTTIHSPDSSVFENIQRRYNPSRLLVQLNAK